MNIKEKASRYDEVLNRAKITLDCCGSTSIATKNAVYDIFPELREPEDEKVRKAILELVKQSSEILDKQNQNNMINWLEKQDKEKSWKPSKEEMDVLYGLAYITNQYDEHKEEVITRLYQDLKREFFNGSSYENMFPNTSTEDDVRRRSTIQVLEYARTLDTYNQYGKADIDKNIAWLEKQGGQKPIGKMQVSEKLYEYIRNTCACIDDALSSETLADITDYLEMANKDAQAAFDMIEKQGEQESDPREENLEELLAADDIYQMAMNDDMVQEAKTKAINALSELQIGKLLGLENQDEQKPTDNNEQKFHEGDWIIGKTSDLVYHVDSVLFPQSKCYYLSYNGETGLVSFADVQNYRLWTIEDAKDGDTLINKNYMGESPFIFKETKPSNIKTDVPNPLTVFGYCGIGGAGFTKSSGWGDTANCIYHPATKEQRDTLLEAMAEAGYTFDFGKKELKKIEHQPLQWNISDYKTWQYIVSDVLTKYDGIGQYLDDGFCKKIAQYMQEIWSKKLSLGENLTWSKEDEANLCQLKTLFEYLAKDIKHEFRIISDNDRDKYTAWLKSLKQKIGE